MLEELKNFLFRGNIVELAVAFVMGLAFAAVITSLVDNLIMPVIAMIIVLVVNLHWKLASTFVSVSGRYACHRFYVRDTTERVSPRRSQHHRATGNKS